MNPVEQSRQIAFQQTLLSARRTMLVSEILKLAIDSFRAYKLRFALTALGMVIGTASVILVVTIGMKGKQYVLETLQKIGTNSVEIEYSGGGATGTERALYTDSLTREDEKAVDTQLPGVMYSSPILEMHTVISLGGGVTKDTLVLGVSPQYRYIRNLLVPYGRFLDDIEVSDCGRFEQELYPFIETNYPGILKTLREKKAFDDALRAETTKALEAFKERFKATTGKPEAAVAR